MRWLLPLIFLACSPAKRLEARENRARAALAESASAYWAAVRWNDSAGASGFLQTSAERLKLAKLLADPASRISEVAVLAVEVESEGDPARPARGTAVVRIDGYASSWRATASTIEQHWVLEERAWKVDAARSPLGEAQAW